MADLSDDRLQGEGGEMYDPDALIPPAEDPAPRDDSSGPSGPTDQAQATSHTDTGGAPDEEHDDLPAFDQRFRDEFEGLLFIGHLTDEFTWLGHRFVIRTLSTDEILEVGLLHKRYAETLADVKAYQGLIVAACIQAIDGRALPQPLGPEDSALLERFQQVRKWYPPTLDAVYSRYLQLESTVAKVIDSLGNPPASSGATSG